MGEGVVYSDAQCTKAVRVFHVTLFALQRHNPYYVSCIYTCCDKCRISQQVCIHDTMKVL